MLFPLWNCSPAVFIDCQGDSTMDKDAFSFKIFCQSAVTLSYIPVINIHLGVCIFSLAADAHLYILFRTLLEKWIYISGNDLSEEF